jgi:hypothetical protein
MFTKRSEKLVVFMIGIQKASNDQPILHADVIKVIASLL